MIKHTIYFFFLWIFFPSLSYCRILPYGVNYITMSTTNANDVSEFNFTMQTQKPIPENGILDITFPTGHFQTGLGLPNTIVVYAPYPKLIPATVTDRTVTCNIGAKPSMVPFVVTIQNIINPMKVGGTGNFKIRSRINSYIIEQNDIFGVIGISDSAQNLISGSMEIESGQSNLAGELTNYIASFVPSDNIQDNIIIRIIFPEIYNLNYVLYDQCESIIYNNFGLQGALRCDVNLNFKNILDINGNSAIIPKGQTVKIRIKKIYNPPLSMTTDLFTFRILDKGSNNTIQIQDSVAGLIIVPGVMTNVALNIYYPNYLPFSTYNRWMKLSFKPKNSFNSIRISTSFSLINKCFISKGLLDLTLTSNIICTPQSNIMFITNFQTYVRSDFANDYIELTFEALIPPRLFKTNPLEIDTYSDLDYLELVDKDIDSESTRITILATPSTAASATIVLSPVTSTPKDQANFIVTLNLGVNYVKPNIVKLEIPSEYSGTPVCQCIFFFFFN